jgi:ferric-dicitrate binding protein FerR (iron transport regulator)
LKNNIIQLIEKYLDGAITPAEEEQLMAWYQEYNEADAEWLSENADEEEQVRLRMFAQLQRHITVSSGKPATNRRWYYFAAAASVLLIVGLAGYFYFPAKQQPRNKGNVQFAQDVGPGSNKAILTLGNGEKVVLEDAKDGVITEQGNAAVNKTDSGRLQYNNISQAEGAPIVYNTLVTPYGGQYQLTLQDGTNVWLNAGSSLRFPASFPRNERKVVLSGEAYFEVSKDAKRPFYVSINSGTDTAMDIRVLGTHFNIKAYPDEQQSVVTLLEGAVNVNYRKASALLTPGKEVVLNKTSGKMNISEVDTEGAVAWKNGYFLFDNEKIEDIMRQVSRWYDVEIRYQGNLSGKAIAGSLSRYKNVSEVLNMLELTGTVHFKLEGRRITVMP